MTDSVTLLIRSLFCESSLCHQLMNCSASVFRFVVQFLDVFDGPVSCVVCYNRSVLLTVSDFLLFPGTSFVATVCIHLYV